tara:strand:+ start:13009 stop:13737 length:729 start_codon:yes stop_codon:yes gene_type:complete
MKQRLDGRKFDEVRPVIAKVGIVKNAIGSAMFQIGKTRAIAAVYGPRELYPRFLQNPEKGLLRCNYNMLPFSGTNGGRIRPGGNRRAKEIGLVTQKALLPALDLSEFPNAVVDVFIEIEQSDAGTRCAGICAASMALAHAGFQMKDLVSAISVGIVDNEIIADIDYKEEHYPEFAKEEIKSEYSTDIPVAMMSNLDKFTLLQLDGRAKSDELKKSLEMAKKACQDIYEIQKKALKQAYEVQK